MKLYSYVLPYDYGFAPNPFWGFCTLANCKPRIRRNAGDGDWVVGVGSPRNVGPGKVVYAMRVDEVHTFDEYANDPRFRAKVPSDQPGRECGDNIYYRDPAGAWWQRSSAFHGLQNAQHDLSGINVLISSHFFYFGRGAIDLPTRYAPLVQWARDYRCSFDPQLVTEFIGWIERSFEPGVLGQPCSAPLGAARRVCLPGAALLTPAQGAHCAPRTAESAAHFAQTGAVALLGGIRCSR